MIVREFIGDRMWRVAVHECEGASVGVLLACKGGVNEEGAWLLASEKEDEV